MRIVEALAPDIIQLHGRETPARVAEIGRRFGCATMKAVGVAAPDDLAAAGRYDGVADYLLIDAKPPKDAALPGGNGLPFDWRLAEDFAPRTPWLLSGGLDPANVARGDRARRARAASTFPPGSSARPAIKDEAKIAAFVAAAREAFARATEGAL